MIVVHTTPGQDEAGFNVARRTDVELDLSVSEWRLQSSMK